jgi:hypothetical protein
MNLLRRLLPGIALIIGTFLLSVGLQALAAWTGPTAAAPGANAYAPLNTGPTAQTKSGNLTVGGQITISGGTPGAGKVLTSSNASGLATWTTPASSGTVTSVATNNGLTGGTITTSGTLGLNLTGISTCTNATTNKIYWNGSYLACGTDQTGGLTGGNTNYVPKWTGVTTLSGTSLIYDNGTNVGIGTASPSEKLHVNGNLYVGSNLYKAGNLTSVNNAISLWGVEGGVLTGFNSGRTVGMGQTTSGYAGFGISSGATTFGAFYYDHFSNEMVVEAYGARNIRFPTNGTTRMTINSSGNVGIGSGMSAPWAQLDVGGSVGTNGVAFRAMDNTFSRYLMIVPYLGAGGYSGVSRSGDSGIFSAQGTGLVISPWNASGIRINSSGYVGVGMGDPAYRLDVAGDINLTGCARNGGTVFAGTCTSDARLKKNIEPLSGSLEKITALNPVSFEFIDSQYGVGLQEGMIAQEVEKIFPDWVIMGEDGYKRIRYGIELQIQLIGAIKDQQKEIEALKVRIDALEAR